MQGYNHVRGGYSGPITDEHIETFHQNLSKMHSNSHLAKYVQIELNKQVLELFNLIEEQVQESNSAPLRRLQSQEEIQSEKTKKHSPYPFQLSVKPSSIPGAGNGVFLNTEKPFICTGTVVALYPGLVHLKESLMDREYIKSILPDPNFMLMSRPDGYVIDGRSVEKVPSNPFALAHLINHCGDKLKPNVSQIYFDFPEDLLDISSFPHNLRRYIPNKYAKEPSMTGRLELATCCMKSVVMVATSPILSGEEILMDYRLNPDSPDLPKWYQSFDADNARKRATSNVQG